MSIILGTVFYLFLFVTEKRKKNKTISRCQEDKNVTQETNQKLINHTNVHSHMKYNVRHDVCNVSFKDTKRKSSIKA